MRAKFNLEKKQSTTDTTQKTVESIFSRPKKSIQLPTIPGISAKTVVKIITGIIVIALLIIGVFSIRSYSKKQSATAQTGSSQDKLSKEEREQVVAKVRKHMVLPEELPQIVAITNVDSLRKQQAFFSLAQNGDQLLVYPAKVILYRPSTDQVVDVAQIRLSPTPASASSSANGN